MKQFNIIIILSFILHAQTSDQIRKAREYIKKTGMSESQVRSAAKAQGISDSQVDAVIEKTKKNKRNISDQLNQSNQPIQQIDISNNSTQTDALLKKTNNKEKGKSEIVGDDKLEFIKDKTLEIQDEGYDFNFEKDQTTLSNNYFGYDIFKGNPEVFQATSFGVVDPDYLIGPGDEIIVMLWGETQFRQVMTVDREGFVFVPEIGQVFVNGLNLNLLESKLFRVLSQSYASLNPSGRKATTFLDISLGNLRPLRIQVLGEIKQPGAYTVSPSATLFSALYYFNGPTELGSLRDIRLIRNNKQIISIDFYDYLLTGKKPKDEKLQLDDIIFIPKRGKTITINGEINRPGIYELKKDETFNDLIQMAGDLKITAYLDRAQIDRVMPFNKRNNDYLERFYVDVNLKDIYQSDSLFNIQNGDIVKIFSIKDMRMNYVSIQGAVARPGMYDIGIKLSLQELIEKSGGLLGDAYKDRIDIIRINPDLKEELIKVDLIEPFGNDSFSDLELQSLDKITIYSTAEMVNEKYVSVYGHVKKPGQYSLKENMTLYDLIFKSGGFIDKEFKNNTYLERAELISHVQDSQKKLIIPFDLNKVLNFDGEHLRLLKPNDEIRVYSKDEIVGEKKYISIDGHVKTPGIYELLEGNMTLYDILFKAGGFDDLIHRSNTFLRRADLIRYDEHYINKRIIPFNLEMVLEGLNDKNFPLQPGDHIRVYPKNIFGDKNKITIKGSVKNTGEYDYKIEMNLKDLILESGGFTGNVSQYKVEVARIDTSRQSEETFADTNTFIVRKDFSLVDMEDFTLQANDFIFVRPDPYFNMQKIITVEGAVYYPGEYVILKPTETISDIISRAGGLREEAYSLGSKFVRNNKDIQIDLQKILKKPKSKENIAVQNDDKLIINSKPNIIQVVGEVSAPGFFSYKQGMRISNVIDEAGGLSPNAEKSDIFIKYPNGKSKKYRRFFNNPKVLDGSIVIVGKKLEEEPFDRTEYFKELTTIAANLAQAISVVVLAKN